MGNTTVLPITCPHVEQQYRLGSTLKNMANWISLKKSIPNARKYRSRGIVANRLEPALRQVLALVDETGERIPDKRRRTFKKLGGRKQIPRT